MLLEVQDAKEHILMLFCGYVIDNKNVFENYIFGMMIIFFPGPMHS